MKIIRFWNVTTVLLFFALLLLASCKHGSYSGSLAYLEKIGEVEMVSKDNSFTNGFGDVVTTYHYTVYYYDTNTLIEEKEAKCMAKLARRYKVYYKLPSDDTQ
ncbi:MAG: hypothetical protein ACTSQF_09075 [Candidatus Heimdallarchaeaceae archaeon]